jgi:hypothetical protein
VGVQAVSVRWPLVVGDLAQEVQMADDKRISGGQDRQRINVGQDYELRDWSEKFGVTPERLKQAVEAVGTQADEVEQYLKRH